MRFNSAALTATAAALCVASAASAETVVITADRMLDVLGGRMVEAPQIVVTDGRIVAVGRRGDQAPAQARHIDLPGETLLPGLLDMHVHLDSDATVSGLDRLRYADG